MNLFGSDKAILKDIYREVFDANVKLQAIFQDEANILVEQKKTNTLLGQTNTLLTEILAGLSPQHHPATGLVFHFGTPLKK